MEGQYKEVYFDEYCKTCAYENCLEKDDPCDECLAIPANIDSHKPVKWKKKEV